LNLPEAKLNQAVFLDRDGVINRAFIRNGTPYPPYTLDEVEILPGVFNALSALKVAGFILIIVTNQPDVARGKQLRKTVEDINNYLLTTLPLDACYTCYHDNADACGCRKPLPGSLLAAAKEHGIQLNQSYMIGDRWRDMEAGLSAGCTSIFIDYGYQEKQPDYVDCRVDSLSDAVPYILGEKTCKKNELMG
jgi:D-glycero-D-manno-heptose 1,7-bisphosphate phosphatase